MLLTIGANKVNREKNKNNRNQRSGYAKSNLYLIRWPFLLLIFSLGNTAYAQQTAVSSEKTVVTNKEKKTNTAKEKPTALIPSVKGQDETTSTSSVKEIVDKIQGYYSSSEDYRASFIQTTSHKMFAGKLDRAYGTVKFKKGGLMKWEYTRPEKKQFIYDGKTLWIYEPEVPQVFSGSADAERLRRALAFVTGEGKLLDEYSVKILNSEKYGFTEGHVLNLIPKDTQSPNKSIELYVDKSTYRVVRSVVIDHENNRNRLDFTNPSLNNNLSAEEFSFIPPKGVPVIDPTKQ